MDISQFRSTDLFIPIILPKTGLVTILETIDPELFHVELIVPDIRTQYFIDSNEDDYKYLRQLKRDIK